MLNKPFVLTLLLIALSFGLGMILLIIAILFGLESGSWISTTSTTGAAMFVGNIYTSKFKIELSKDHKTKIALYYFIIQLVLSFGVLFLVQEIRQIAAILAVATLLNIITALAIYFLLGLGCKSQLKQLEKNSASASQTTAKPAYAESADSNTLITNETELSDVRYCQFCGAEFDSNENICPVCEKVND